MRRFIGCILLLISLGFALSVGSNLNDVFHAEKDFRQQMDDYALKTAEASNGLIASLASVGYSAGDFSLGIAVQKEHEDEIELTVSGFVFMFGVYLVARRQKVPNSTVDMN